MKYILIAILFLFSFSYSADMLDADYSFIDHAFENTKPVTPQQFEKAINSKTFEPVPDTFGGKLKAFLFGRKQVQNPISQTQEEKSDPVSEAQLIKEMKNGIYYIKLVAPVISYDNKVIPAGNYKIKEEKVNEQSMLNFYQGYDNYGMLKLYKYNDNLKNSNDITYSRVDIVSDSIIRIVYSTIEDTKCAFARVYKAQ